MDDSFWGGAGGVPTPFGWLPPSLLQNAAKAMAPEVANTLGAPVDALSWVIRQHPWGRPSDPANPYGRDYFWSSPGNAAKTISQNGARPNYTPTPRDQLPTQLPPVLGSEWWRNTLGSMFGALGGAPDLLDRSGRTRGSSPSE